MDDLIVDDDDGGIFDGVHERPALAIFFKYVVERIIVISLCRRVFKKLNKVISIDRK
jgi:hypothetical protein